MSDIQNITDRSASPAPSEQTPSPIEGVEVLAQSPASRLDPAWSGARALVVGLGESGLAMAKWLSMCGAQMSVLDSRAEPPGKATLLASVPQASLLHASLGEFSCEGYDLLAWSPGLSIEVGESAQLYLRAKSLGIPVYGELDLFLSVLASQGESGYRPKLLGITGTNGKTTVTALTAHLCRAAGLRAQAAGNIGPSMLDAWIQTDALLPQVWVLELSSFQVAASHLTVGHKIFDAATVLNLSQDHLDWHASMSSYQQAKVKLLMATKVQIVGDDTSLMYKEVLPEPVKPSRSLAAKTAAQTVPAPAMTVDAPLLSRVVRFSSGAPPAIGDFGMVQDGSLKWLAAGTPGEDIPTRRKGVQTELIIKRLMPADALKIRGQHNHLNVLAALALCRALALPLSSLLHGLRDYHGEPHRCELVAIIDDIEYIDDSKGTNVGATVAGLEIGRAHV